MDKVELEETLMPKRLWIALCLFVSLTSFAQSPRESASENRRGADAAGDLCDGLRSIHAARLRGPRARLPAQAFRPRAIPESSRLRPIEPRTRRVQPPTGPAAR